MTTQLQVNQVGNVLGEGEGGITNIFKKNIAFFFSFGGEGVRNSSLYIYIYITSLSEKKE